MPSVAIQTEPTGVVYSPVPTPPMTPLFEPNSMESSTATLIDDYFLSPRPEPKARPVEPVPVVPSGLPHLYKRRLSGTFEPVGPIIINIEHAQINAHRVEILSPNAPTSAPRATRRSPREYVPAWVDNLEGSVYTPIRWISPIVRPVLRGGFMAYGWVTDRFIIGLNLGFLNFRSAP